MEYIKKEELIKVFTEMRDARFKKRNCSSTNAVEYRTFDYVLKIIESMKSYEKD